MTGIPIHTIMAATGFLLGLLIGRRSERHRVWLLWEDYKFRGPSDPTGPLLAAILRGDKPKGP